MWAQLLNAAVGVWLMAAPAVLGYDGALAVSDRIVGPCIGALAGVAVGGCTRNVRLWLLPFAVWLLIAPFALGGEDASAVTVASELASGAVVIGLALVRGHVPYDYGGGWTAVFRSSSHQATTDGGTP